MGKASRDTSRSEEDKRYDQCVSRIRVRVEYIFGRMRRLGMDPAAGWSRASETTQAPEQLDIPRGPLRAFKTSGLKNRHRSHQKHLEMGYAGFSGVSERRLDFIVTNLFSEV